MVDVEIVAARLRALDRYLAKLRRLAGLTLEEYVNEDRDEYAKAEHFLHLAAECAIDVAFHVVADRGLPVPETNREAFGLLAKHGVLSEGLAARMGVWAGFRNVLVHDYMDIDHSVSHRALRERLGDLEEFARAASGLLGP